MLIAIKPSGGMLPGSDPRLLKDNQAQVAINAKLIEGDLQSWHALLYVTGLTKFGGTSGGGGDPSGITGQIDMSRPGGSQYLPVWA